jgi:hypothetical protein
MNHANQFTYSIATLVDITKTDVTSSKNYEYNKERNQQRNWETLSQVLNLRTQAILVETPKCIREDVSKYCFGNAYSGEQNIWIFRFIVEFENVLGTDDDTFKFLRHDLELVPIITGLDETVTINPPILVPQGFYKNTTFLFISAS